MLHKLRTTLPSIVHSIFSKLNKDEANGDDDENDGEPSSAASPSSTQPAPLKRTNNPFFMSRDYLEHTLDAINSKIGLNVPTHMYHALVTSLIANDHCLIDSSYIDNDEHSTGFSLLNILPYLVSLRCAYVSCTSSTSSQELFRKIVDPHSEYDAPDHDEMLHSLSHTLPHPPQSPLYTSSLSHTLPLPEKQSRSLNTAEAPIHRNSQKMAKRSRLRASEHVRENSFGMDIPGSSSSRDSTSIRSQTMHTQVLVVDNLMSAPQNTLEALFQIIQTRQVPLKGYKYNTPATFIVIAISGKKRFPVISPCPFLSCIPLFEPLATSHSTEIPSLALTEDEILQARSALPLIYMAQDMHQYMRSMVIALRTHAAVDIGPDTRATAALETAVRASAVVAGQKFVTPSHILSVVAQVLNHRIELVGPHQTPANPPSTTPHSSAHVLQESVSVPDIHFTQPSLRSASFLPPPPAREGLHQSTRLLTHVHAMKRKSQVDLAVQKPPSDPPDTLQPTPSLKGKEPAHPPAHKAAQSAHKDAQHAHGAFLARSAPAFSKMAPEKFTDSFQVIEFVLDQLDAPV